MEENSKKIVQTNTYDMVFYSIRSDIKNEVYPPRTKLPSEQELSEIYGVNRLTIRMALQRLRTIGLIETKTGDGTYVIGFSFMEYINGVGDLYTNPELLDNISEFRSVIEVECTRLAIENATDEEINGLELLITDYENYKNSLTINYTQEQIDQLAMKDIQIHYEITELSHNKLFTYAHIVAKEALFQYMRVILKKRLDSWSQKYGNLSIGDDTHRRIYSAILGRNFPLAKQLLLDMINREIDLT